MIYLYFAILSVCEEYVLYTFFYQFTQSYYMYKAEQLAEKLLESNTLYDYNQSFHSTDTWANLTYIKNVLHYIALWSHF